MKIIGTIFGIVCLLLMLVAFIPLLGWLNWLNVPLAIIGLIFSSIGNSSAGKTMCIITIVGGILRLMLGGGII